MLHQQDIARHQVRTGDAGKLVIRKVPGLDAEDHADRTALHMAFAEAWMEFDGRQEAFGVLGVIGEDARAELHLAAGLVDALAHLERHDVRQLVDLRMHERGGLGDDFGPLGICLVAQVSKQVAAAASLALKLLVGEFLERLQHFAVGRVDALVGHGLCPFRFHRAGARDVRDCRQASMITLSAFVLAACPKVS